MTRSFEFTAGSPALNFIDTIAARGRDPVELIATPDDLSRWLNLAGFKQDFLVGLEQLQNARDVREAASDVLAAAVDLKAPPEGAINTLNIWSAGQDFRPQLKNGEIVLVSERPFESVLAHISADALLLLQADKVERLRRCTECGMLFFDQSRPGKRRWCSSSSGCGNRAKVRRHRERKRLEGSA